MVKKNISIGGLRNIVTYDDVEVPKAIEVDGPIKAGEAQESGDLVTLNALNQKTEKIFCMYQFNPKIIEQGSPSENILFDVQTKTDSIYSYNSIDGVITINEIGTYKISYVVLYHMLNVSNRLVINIIRNASAMRPGEGYGGSSYGTISNGVIIDMTSAPFTIAIRALNVSPGDIIIESDTNIIIRKLIQ